MADNKKPSGLKFSPWWISGAIIFLFVLLDIFNSTGFQDPTKISSSKFDELLNSGQIEKVIVFNKVQAEAYLNSKALKDKSNSKVAKDPVFGGVNKGPHYVF
jgi:cell division protease FtsH